MARARTQEAKDERRKIFLKMALEEFYEKGFTAARMEDIAERADVSKGTLYLYFASKEELFNALIDNIALPNLEQIESITKSMPSIELAIRNIANFGPHVILNTDLPRLMKVIISESQAFPEMVEAYRQRVLLRLLGIISGLLKAAKERGEIEIGDPEHTAKLLMAPMVLSGLWTAMFGSEGEAKLDVEGLLQTHADLFLKAIIRKDPDA